VNKKRIEIKNLSNPRKCLEKLENEFIDIMYVDYIQEKSLILFMDKGIEPNDEKDLDWISNLISKPLNTIGETNFKVLPFEK
jgi:hypothetical protein